MGKKVAVLGGGVAGLTAAHELVDRGFEVEVYEFKAIPGGKARSMPYSGSAVGDRSDLPGEHGFRLFPKFYRHVIDSMKKIPYENGKVVYDNLVEVPRLDISTDTHPLVPLVTEMKFSLDDLRDLIKLLFDNKLGLTEADLEQYTSKLWQVMTSCDERRENEYQDIPWWEFIEADKYSPAFRKVFGNITKTLVACKSTKANTKTVGTVAAQMTLDILTPGLSFVRILDGPTNNRWIDAWVHYIESKGAIYETEAQVKELHYKNGQISGVTVVKNGESSTITADYYVAAFPVEIMSEFITNEMASAHDELANIRLLSKSIDWMNGIQFYLKEDVPVAPGHVMYFDSPWSLTSISQAQFWDGFDWSNYGDGQVKGVLSVDISDWETEGIHIRKPAMDCTPEEIKEEVWEQLKRGLNVGCTILRDEVLHSWFLDTDIHFENPHHTVNLEPLLINEVGTWELRPNAYTSIPNLFLASDYVKTNTDLATMEGANEAGRRAVNAILHAAGSSQKLCKIWEMYEYDFLGVDYLAPWHAHDRHRYHKGLPWDGKI
ncbi:phytoene dehydrogenase [Paenibacillus sp. FSL H7-0326]|uniref:hydroxysqualene dehydroxylase n=1 Tax=Paenibacillus sp. FSL H7-0326 TaxID=1921144 RepID=UPI00096EEA12|nr:FAD-dependent oxidoreductase [Paenibacillus sp. FSL H7-0326]OMC67360.1 phytoene dehydrogenase [Paenibacillus sp. FSL H7-0326]